MTSTLRQLPLAERHRALGARFAPFAGWEMPVQYSGIVEEHHAVRERAGVFDVSHMGRLYVSGPQAGRALRHAVTYNVEALEEGEAHYALMCNEDGGILDDLFVYRLTSGRYLVVNNAANASVGRERIASALQPGVDLEDRQESTVMLALQGPQAITILSRVIDAEPPARRRCVEVDWLDSTLFICRTGYTGEDGVELVTPVAAGGALLERLVAEGVAPCGLGARDTLRLEAALPLYGNDIDTGTNPWEAGLGFAVSLDDGAAFAGRAALEAAEATPVERTLGCLQAQGRGIMRAGCSILHGGRTVASMSSGGFSPTLGVSIGMAYLPVELAQKGTELEVDVRGKPLAVSVVPRPFYRRPRRPKKAEGT
ncbi:MAG: glycine cleavage system aminomethyltransferase GcvT [Chloroflexi bacterium]|nr:glycine cleavage system aminomethyltransferase GcvT [Chloroflexota bacterium]